MRILIMLHRLNLGGTETYSVTLAEQLERLGHSVRLHAAEEGRGRELVESRAVELSVGDPERCADLGSFDAAVAQDTASAYAIAAHGRGIRLVFVMHGLTPHEHPPAGLDPAPALVVLNDRIGDHAARLADASPPVRLRQPIDLERFTPSSPSRPSPRRVLILSNYLDSDRLRILERVCDELSLDLAQVGHPRPVLDPGPEIAAADIVVGYGRSLLEAMAQGRAAYVWDRAGGDGWVTAESYPALEASGFNGSATEAVIDAERLRADWAAYRPELGTLGVDMVRVHSAARHAETIVELLEAGGSRRRQETAETMAVLARAETRAEEKAAALELRWRRTAAEYEALEGRVAAVKAAEDAERAGRLAAEARLEDVFASWSWRLTRAPRWLGALLRRLRAASRR
jgi:hypothetical protein